MIDKIDRPEAMAQRIRHLELELKRAKNPANKYERTVAPTVRGKVYPNFVPLTTPLTSTAWDGDSFSTTGKTLIDLSAVFGVPAGIKACLFSISLRDSGSQTNDCYMYIGATNVQYEGAAMNCGYANDRWNRGTLLAPCDANGDCYYELNASGTNTMDIYLSIIGYWL